MSFARRPAFVTPALLGAGALCLYVICLPPSFAFWDTGELQTVASILGIAHPPAAPAFVLLSWVVVHVMPLGEDAWRVNFTCALAVAVSVGLLYATMRLFGVPPLTSAMCTAGFAVAEVPWQDATRAEVQDVALLFRAAAFFLTLHWTRSRSPAAIVGAGLCMGLGLATHGIALLLVPALLLLFIDVVRRESPKRYRFRTDALRAAAGCVLGLLPYVYLPLRSAAVARAALDPTLSLGLPAGMPFWNYDDPHTWHNFVRVVTAADFNVHSGFAGFYEIASYPAYAAALVRRLVGAYGFVGCALAGVGAVVLAYRRRAWGAALVIAALLVVPYTESYVELQDPSRYYLLTLWCSAIAIGAGFEFVADLMALVPRSIGRFAIACVLAGSFAVAAPERGSLFNQRYDRNAPRYVTGVVATTPRNAVVVAEWAYATPLAYAAYVQQSFGCRIVVSAAPTQFARLYRRWLRTRPVYIVSFDDALSIPRFTVVPITTSWYYEYRVDPARPLSRRYENSCPNTTRPTPPPAPTRR